MKIFRKVLLGGLISSSALFAGYSLLNIMPPQIRASVLQQQPEKKYKLFCINGKVEIGTRTLADVKWARGESVCLLDSFDDLSQAEEAARRYGGIGGDCSCP